MSDLDKINTPEGPEQSSEINNEPSAATNSTDKAAAQPGKTNESDSQTEGKTKAAEKIADLSKKAAEKTGQFIGSSYEKVKDYDPQTSVHMLERLLNWARGKFPPSFFDKISDWLTKYGHAGIVLAQVLVVVFYLFNAIKLSSIIMLFQGAGICLLLVILQYTANKFLAAGKNLIESTPSRLSSSAFLDCTALLLEVIGLFVTIALASRGLISFIIGVGIWALLDAIAFTALHPSLVNVSIEKDIRAGEEAIGILSYFAKAILKIVPIAYGVGAIVGSAALSLAIVAIVIGKGAEAGKSAVALVIACTCLPFVSYILFMIYHLFIDLLRAILVIPGKIDDLNKDN